MKTALRGNRTTLLGGYFNLPSEEYQSSAFNVLRFGASSVRFGPSQSCAQNVTSNCKSAHRARDENISDPREKRKSGLEEWLRCKKKNVSLIWQYEISRFDR